MLVCMRLYFYEFINIFLNLYYYYKNVYQIYVSIFFITITSIGLYNESEQVYAFYQDNPPKIIFLDKIIQVVSLQLQTPITARSDRIIAGLDQKVSVS